MRKLVQTLTHFLKAAQDNITGKKDINTATACIESKNGRLKVMYVGVPQQASALHLLRLTVGLLSAAKIEEAVDLDAIHLARQHLMVAIEAETESLKKAQNATDQEAVADPARMPPVSRSVH